MSNSTKTTFPGGSKSRVNKAGENIRNRQPTWEDLRTIEDWRAAHRSVLNTFQAILRNRTRGTTIIVVQRHKRRSTIYGKLDRYPGMRLARMDDVAGCRLIFRDIVGLYSFRNQFHKARFNHKRKNDVDKYDYIKDPKTTGYRGVHDVYEYDVNSVSGRSLKGLLVEIQYRTLVQHAWATAVEVIGFITENQPKFEEGDDRYLHVMALASEILARSFENATGPFPEMNDGDLVSEFLRADGDLGLMQTLRGLNATRSGVGNKRNVILIVPQSGELEVLTFRDATEALRNLFVLEKERPKSDIVLVRGDSTEDVRLAFRNYFSDARDFVKFIEVGCQKLSGKKIIVDGLLVKLKKKKRR